MSNDPVHPELAKAAPVQDKVDPTSAYVTERELAQRHSFANSRDQLLALQRPNRVPEHFFKTYLLPVMRPWLKQDQANQDYGHWMNISGGPDRPIHVVQSDVVKDPVLFVAPAPLAKTPVVVLERKGNRVVTPDDVLSLQEAHSRNQDQRAWMQIEAALPSLFSLDVGVDVQKERMLQFLFIWERYELPLEELFGEQHEAIVRFLKGEPPVESERTEVKPNEEDEGNATGHFVY